MNTEDFRQKAVFRSRGHLYEDFEVGQEFVHHWGRTITESRYGVVLHDAAAPSILYISTAIMPRLTVIPTSW